MSISIQFTDRRQLYLAIQNPAVNKSRAKPFVVVKARCNGKPSIVAEFATKRAAERYAEQCNAMSRQ